MKTLFFVIGAALLIAGPARAATLSSVDGTTNGDVIIHLSDGTQSTVDVFSRTTRKRTTVKKLNTRFLVAVSGNGKRVAMVRKNGTVKRVRLDGRYPRSAVKIMRTDEDDIVVIVRKNKRRVSVTTMEQADNRLEQISNVVVRKKNVAPARTRVLRERGRIQLRNRHKRLRTTVYMDDDFDLSEQHAPASCANAWFDTHTHADDLDVTQHMVTRMDDKNVGCALVFTLMNVDELADNYQDVVNLVAQHPGRFVPFYTINPQRVSDITVNNLQRVLNRDSNNLFRGIGEYAFYRQPLLNTRLDSAPWPAVFEWAADNDLIIMIHLVSSQGDELDTMLTNHPNTTVLLHGNELLDELPQLLEDHENLYYTLDTANMLRHPQRQTDTVLMFPADESENDGISDKRRARTFSALYDTFETTMLNTAVSDWADVFAAAPDRVMWGTDVASQWHTRRSAYNRLMRFSRMFRGELGAGVQTRYRTTNARELLGDGVTLP